MSEDTPCLAPLRSEMIRDMCEAQKNSEFGIRRSLIPNPYSLIPNS